MSDSDRQILKIFGPIKIGDVIQAILGILNLLIKS